MNKFLLRLLVTLIVLYGVGAVAYALLHYPAGERPGVGDVLGDFTRDLNAVFRSKEPARPVVPGPGSPAPTAAGAPELDASTSLDDARLSLSLSQVRIPDSGRLPASAAPMWDTLRPIHAEVLPEGIEALGRLRPLKSADKNAFERDRSAVRARLAAARGTLLPYTQEPAPLEAAVKLLDVLDRLDAFLAGL